jgi:hypothetical protein
LCLAHRYQGDHLARVFYDLLYARHYGLQVEAYSAHNLS